MSDDEYINRCVVCGVDMGDCNPRQYCMKTYCPLQLETIDLTGDETPVIDLTRDETPVIIDITGDEAPVVIDLTRDETPVLVDITIE